MCSRILSWLFDNMLVIVMVGQQRKITIARTIIVASLMTLVAGCATSPSKPGISIQFTLPPISRWTEITNIANGVQYLHEWVPSGFTAEDTPWIISEQKFMFATDMDAGSYISNIFALAKNACTSILYNGPYRISEVGLSTYAGRFFCAQIVGKSYGTVTEQRVIATGSVVYVVTSELRMPSSPHAGVIMFTKDQVNQLRTFLTRREASSQLVFHGIEICGAAGSAC